MVIVLYPASQDTAALVQHLVFPVIADHKVRLASAATAQHPGSQDTADQ